MGKILSTLKRFKAKAIAVCLSVLGICMLSGPAYSLTPEEMTYQTNLEALRKTIRDNEAARHAPPQTSLTPAQVAYQIELEAIRKKIRDSGRSY